MRLGLGFCNPRLNHLLNVRSAHNDIIIALPRRARTRSARAPRLGEPADNNRLSDINGSALSRLEANPDKLPERAPHLQRSLSVALGKPSCLTAHVGLLEWCTIGDLSENLWEAIVPIPTDLPLRSAARP